jgi:hypothetical protein
METHPACIMYLGIDSFNFLELLGGKFGITAAKKFGSGFNGSVRDIPVKYVNRIHNPEIYPYSTECSGTVCIWMLPQVPVS